MCLAVPVKIISIEDKMGLAQIGEVKRKISLILLDEVATGDWVLLHAGFAISKIKEKEAQEIISLFQEMGGQ